MDYFQCNILLVGSLFKLVTSLAQQCPFFTCTYTFQFRVNWNQLENPIFFFPIVVIFLHMGISRVLMSDLTLCGCPNMDLSCPDGSHPFSQPLLSSADGSGSSHFIRSLFVTQAGLECHFGQWASQQCCLGFHCTVMS